MMKIQTQELESSTSEYLTNSEPSSPTNNDSNSPIESPKRSPKYLARLAQARAQNRSTGGLTLLESYKDPKGHQIHLPKGVLRVQNTNDNMTLSYPAGNYYIILNIGVTLPENAQPNIEKWTNDGLNLCIINLNDSAEMKASSQAIESEFIGHSQNTVNILIDVKKDFTKNLKEMSEFNKDGTYFLVYKEGSGIVIAEAQEDGKYKESPGFLFTPKATRLQVEEFYNIARPEGLKEKKAQNKDGNEQLFSTLTFSGARAASPSRANAGSPGANSLNTADSPTRRKSILSNIFSKKQESTSSSATPDLGNGTTEELSRSPSKKLFGKSSKS